MNLKSTFLFVSILAAFTTMGQTLGPDAGAYNWPYDSLVVYGDKGASSSLILGRDNPGLGIMFLNRAIEIQPENPLAYERKAKAYLDFKMLDEATDAYSQCLEYDPANPNCLYGMFYISFLGSSAYQLADVPLPMINQIYNSAMAFLNVAPASMAQEKSLAELLGYTMKLGIDNYELYKKYAPIVIAENLDESNYQSAEELIQPISASGNNHVLANIYDKLCFYYWNLDNVAKTKEYGLKGLATGLGYTTTYYYLGYTYYYDEKNTAEAIKMLEDALKKEGAYDRASNLLASIQYNEGSAAFKAKNYAGSIAYLSNYVQNNPESERGFAYLGFSQYNSKKYADAAKSLKKVKELANPANVTIYYPNLAALIAFAEKPSTTAPAPAIKTTLIELEANEAIFNEAAKLAANKQYADAIAKYEEALTYFNTTGDKPYTELVYNRMALNYHDLENYEKAKEYYAKSIDLGASSSTSYAYYALILYAADNDYAKAETVLNDGLVKFPDDETIISTKGGMYINKAYDIYKTNDYAGSIPYFEKGLELKTDARAYIYLGYSYNETGNTEKAVEAWKNAFYYNEDLKSEFTDVYEYVQSR